MATIHHFAKFSLVFIFFISCTTEKERGRNAAFELCECLSFNTTINIDSQVINYRKCQDSIMNKYKYYNFDYKIAKANKKLNDFTEDEQIAIREFDQSFSFYQREYCNDSFGNYIRASNSTEK